MEEEKCSFKIIFTKGKKGKAENKHQFGNQKQEAVCCISPRSQKKKDICSIRSKKSIYSIVFEEAKKKEGID